MEKAQDTKQPQTRNTKGQFTCPCVLCGEGTKSDDMQEKCDDCLEAEMEGGY